MKLTLNRLLLMAALVSVSCAGCSAKYHQRVLEESATKLETGKAVFISIPEDGFYGDQTYRNSGEMTAQALKEAFAAYTNRIEISNRCRGEACFGEIAEGSFAYYVCPEILHWEERATEWSGLPDQIRVKVVIYAVNDRSVISSAILQGKSKFFTFGGDHPQDLLPKPISQYLQELYGSS